LVVLTTLEISTLATFLFKGPIIGCAHYARNLHPRHFFYLKGQLLVARPASEISTLATFFLFKRADRYSSSCILFAYSFSRIFINSV
jgi:hypothetical protein